MEQLWSTLVPTAHPLKEGVSMFGRRALHLRKGAVDEPAVQVGGSAPTIREDKDWEALLQPLQSELKPAM